MKPTRVIIAGSGGRMGRTLLEALWGNADFELIGALDSPGEPVGQDAGAALGHTWGIKISSEVDKVLQLGGCLIDFTRPAGTLNHLASCLKYANPMVIGTTGFDESQRQTLASAAKKIPILLSPNMSLGVNVLFRLMAEASHLLQPDYDVEIFEAHHRQKADAPSGTALKLGEVCAKARGLNFANDAVFTRYGHVGPRKDNSIGFSVVRGGDIVGDHTVMFAGMGEKVEITHRATSRMPYAKGALLAAAFLTQRTAGLYDMADALGMK